MEILKNILAKEKEKKELIKAFQDRIWNGAEFNSDESVKEILSALAHDLDYYESSESLRNEDSSYYGNDRLNQVISSALEKIEKIKGSSA